MKPKTLIENTIENPLVLNWDGREYKVNKPLDQSGKYVDLNVAERLKGQPQTLTEAVNLGRRHSYIIGQVAGINNKAIRVLNRLLMDAQSLDEVNRVQGAINDLMEESRLLLKEAEALTPHEKTDI